MISKSILTALLVNGVSLVAISFAKAQVSDAEQTATATQISTSLKSIGVKVQANQTTTQATPNVPASGPAKVTLDSFRPEVLAAIESCATKTTVANNMCLETTAPALGSFMAKYGALVQGAGQAVSALADACSDAGKAISAANIAMGAFQAACATAQGVCESSCATLEPLAETYLELSSQTLQSGVANAVEDVRNAGLLKIKTKQAILNCAKYSIKVENAIAGGTLALIAHMQTKKCEEQTSDTGGVNCSDSANAAYNTKACMCTRNELPAAECQGMGVALSGGVRAAPIAAGDRSGASISGDVSGGADYGVKGESSFAGDMGGSAGGAGAPMGGGGGAGGGGAPGGAAQDGVANNRRMNTNIIGGFGGGGGGGRGGGGPGYGEVDAKLLKQAAEKSRSLASQTPPQITGQAGRSNWEKVKSRYMDNANRLLTSPR
ncbi:MAG: hypothetical protein ACK5V3_00430 [Bdellovibrionales bacterium]